MYFGKKLFYSFYLSCLRAISPAKMSKALRIIIRTKKPFGEKPSSGKYPTATRKATLEKKINAAALEKDSLETALLEKTLPSENVNPSQTTPPLEESYLRHEEKTKIKEFLNSSNNILHISGSPGTGKTLTVKNMLKERNHTYINYMLDKDLIDKNHMTNNGRNACSIRGKGPVNTHNDTLIVIDEFDKFYEKRKECKSFLIKHSDAKIITLSNNLNFDSVLFFRPYTKDEILFIVKEKIKEARERVPDDVIELVSLRVKNDLRKVIAIITDLLVINDERLTGKQITLSDVLVKKRRRESIHQQIIHELKETFGRKEEAFKNYLVKCRELRIDGLDRIDFASVYENLD